MSRPPPLPSWTVWPSSSPPGWRCSSYRRTSSARSRAATDEPSRPPRSTSSRVATCCRSTCARPAAACWRAPPSCPRPVASASATGGYSFQSSFGRPWVISSVPVTASGHGGRQIGTVVAAGQLGDDVLEAVAQRAGTPASVYANGLLAASSVDGAERVDRLSASHGSARRRRPHELLQPPARCAGPARGDRRGRRPRRRLRGDPRFDADDVAAGARARACGSSSGSPVPGSARDTSAAQAELRRRGDQRRRASAAAPGPRRGRGRRHGTLLQPHVGAHRRHGRRARRTDPGPLALSPTSPWSARPSPKARTPQPSSRSSPSACAR